MGINKMYKWLLQRCKTVEILQWRHMKDVLELELPDGTLIRLSQKPEENCNTNLPKLLRRGILKVCVHTGEISPL